MHYDDHEDGLRFAPLQKIPHECFDMFHTIKAFEEEFKKIVLLESFLVLLDEPHEQPYHNIFLAVCLDQVFEVVRILSK